MHIIVQVQSGSSLHLRLGLVQRALHGHMRRPGAIKVLVQGEHIEAAEHLIVKRRDLPRQPAGQTAMSLTVAQGTLQRGCLELLPQNVSDPSGQQSFSTGHDSCRFRNPQQA